MHARRGALVAVGLIVALAFIANIGSAMAPGRAAGRIYGDGELWATFVTTGLKPGPERSFNLLYVFPGTGLIPVTDSLPGDVDYRGGRWIVFAVSFVGIEPIQLTSDAEVLHHASLGHLSITGEPVAYVSCPLFAL